MRDSGIAAKLIRTPFEQKQDQNGRNEDTTRDECLPEIAERHLDERGWPKARCIELEAFESWTQLLDCLFYIPTDFQGVCPKLLFHDEQQARTVVDDGIANRDSASVFYRPGGSEPETAGALHWGRAEQVGGDLERNAQAFWTNR
jgi:hypothetical protein